MRYWWVVVKLVLTVTVIGTAVGVTNGWVAGAEAGDASPWLVVVAGAAAHLVLLVVAAVVSVDKPWPGPDEGGPDASADPQGGARRPHHAAAGAWIGIDVVLGVLVVTALLTGDAGTTALCYQVLPLLFWPMITTAVLSLATGVGLGLGTHYGLLRYWWVAVELGLNVLPLALVAVVLRPGLVGAAAQGRAMAGGAPAIDHGGLLFPPIVSTTLLLVTTTLALYRPWGRIRRRHAVPAARYDRQRPHLAAVQPPTTATSPTPGSGG